MNSEAPGRHAQSNYIDFTANILANGLHALPPVVRGHVVAVLGELVGTTLFLFFAFAGTQVANVSSNTNTGTTVITTTVEKTPQQLLYISLSFGFSLAVNAWVFFRISGGLFNPAVTVGMYLIGAINFTRAVILFITQLVGAIIAAEIVQALFTGGLNVSTTLSSTTTIAQGVIIEMILTLQLVFTIFMLAAEKHTGNFIAPVGIGLSLFIAELVGVFWTGGSLNPARTLGPAVAIRQFRSEHWVYWVGPLAGTCLAVILYKLIKALEYESLAPAGGDEESGDTNAELGPAPPHGRVGGSGHPDTMEYSEGNLEKGKVMNGDVRKEIRPGLGMDGAGAGRSNSGMLAVQNTSYRVTNRPLMLGGAQSSYRNARAGNSHSSSYSNSNTTRFPTMSTPPNQLTAIESQGQTAHYPHGGEAHFDNATTLGTRDSNYEYTSPNSHRSGAGLASDAFVDGGHHQDRLGYTDGGRPNEQPVSDREVVAKY